MLKLVNTEVAVGKVAKSKRCVRLTQLFNDEAVLVVTEAETAMLFTCSNT